jgi:hypothetical protein
MRLLVAIALAALALPAASQAEDAAWQRVADPAPGGTTDAVTPKVPHVALAVVGDTPYVASLSEAGVLTVSRPNRAGTSWVHVGAPLSRSPSVSEVELASDGRRLWAAWTEADRKGVTDVKVARLVGGRFRVIATDLNRSNRWDAGDIQLEVAAGRVYVAFDRPWKPYGGRIAVVRMGSSGGRAEYLTAGLPVGGLGEYPHLAAAGRVLHLAWQSASGGALLARLGAGARAWQMAPEQPPVSAGDLAVVGNTLYVASPAVYRQTASGHFVELPGHYAQSLGVGDGKLYAGYSESPGPDGAGPFEVAALDGESWHEVPSPGAPDHAAWGEFATGPDGALWLIWQEAPNLAANYTTWTVHVARLVTG